MIATAIRNGLDQFLGRGSASVTVPPMDGALKPNNLLDEAQSVMAVAEPDNLALRGDDLIFSSGNQILCLDRSAGGATSVLHRCGGVVTALAVSPAQAIVAALQEGGLAILGGAHGGRTFASLGDQPMACITALAFADESTVLVAVGSEEHAIDAWQRDLLMHGRSGSVWRLDLGSGQATRLIGNLAYPNGLLIQPDGGHVVISESWEKSLIRVKVRGGRKEILLDDLPGYPARLATASNGGAWLSVFAPRSQLIEFVLRERKYRQVMMAEVAPEYWIAPALRSGVSFREPMQGGALKQMGILKPWAPTRSYGLVIELSHDFEAIRSLHSRAAGRRHGITSALATQGALWMTSKGGDEVIKIDFADREA